jgi:predicted acylesterase/phospholipase RssA
MADNWRGLDPFLPMDVNLNGMWPMSNSLLTWDNFRARVLPYWNIDFGQIQNSTKTATFNVFNFSKKQLEIIAPAQMTEDYLVASVSLPMWFPPVTINGDTYFDAVYISDANLAEAVRRGADEIWAIWTVSKQDVWKPGFIAEYFQIIETVADTNFFTYWKRLETNNAEIAAGRPGEFGRTIALNLIEAEVPVHYLLNMSKDRMAEAVNKGVEDARAWCAARNIALTPGPPSPAPPSPAMSSISFVEEMTGFLGKGIASTSHAEFESAAAQGKDADGAFMFHLTVSVDDVDTFVTSPQHRAGAAGYVDSPLVGGQCAVTEGTINLLVDAGHPAAKQMKYRLFFTGQDGKPYTLAGVKDISGQNFASAWPETTTLYTTLLDGRVDDGAAGVTVASGVIVIRPQDFFFRQLFSFSVDGPSLVARAQALNRFGAMFMGKLWDVYGQQIQPF